MTPAGHSIPQPSGFPFEDVPIEYDVAGNIIYPECDGKPLSNNTEHMEWIVYLHDGLKEYYRNDPEVLVVSDLLWYPVEGNPSIRVAPDVMVIFGVPKGRRGSYQQWKESGIPPQVVFEIISPGNTVVEMLTKQAFFSAYGVEEYYVYDCDSNHLQVWLRNGAASLAPVPETEVEGWVSPKLGMRFWLHRADGLTIELPNGKAMATYAEVNAQRVAAESARVEADSARLEAEAARVAAEAERDRLAAKLRELGIDPNVI